MISAWRGTTDNKLKNSVASSFRTSPWQHSYIGSLLDGDPGAQAALRKIAPRRCCNIDSVAFMARHAPPLHTSDHAPHISLPSRVARRYAAGSLSSTRSCYLSTRRCARSRGSRIAQISNNAFLAQQLGSRASRRINDSAKHLSVPQATRSIISVSGCA